MTKYLVTNIEWDCDSETPIALGLPANSLVNADNEEDVVDFLSDLYGYCIKSVESIKPTDKTPRIQDGSQGCPSHPLPM